MNAIDCPDCNQSLSAHATRCSCGWKKTEVPVAGPRDERCHYVLGNRRCPLPGSVSPTVGATSLWYCSGHRHALEDPKEAERILNEAEKIDPSQLSQYRSWRDQMLADYLANHPFYPKPSDKPNDDSSGNMTP